MDTGTFSGFELTLRSPGIAWFQFNTPERLNGMTTAIKRDLVEAITQAQMDNAVRVVVFTGSGRAFCAGDDLKAYRDAELPGKPLVPAIPPGHDSGIGTYDGLRIVSQRVNTAIRGLDKLSIAAINGIAIQTGFSLALACDFRIASTSARVGSATLRFGLLPDEGGQYLLVQLMGVARTMDFLMRKRIIDANEALALGLVHEVVDPAALEQTTMNLATELANGPQVSMRLLKRSVYNAAELSFDQALDEIAANGDSPITTRIRAKGLRRFAKKGPRASMRGSKSGDRIMNDSVSYESLDGTAIVTINRAEKMNALNEDVIQGLHHAWQRFAASDDRVAILHAAGGRAFSVGADIKDPPKEMWQGVPSMGVPLDKPVIAAVHGWCIGGAYVIVQMCDLVVASANTVFKYPEAQVGFTGGLIASAVARLPHKIAMEFMLLGEDLSAERAYAVGMVNKVVPVGTERDAAFDYARILMRSAPLVVSTLKRFALETMNKSPAEAAALARHSLLGVRDSEDGAEGRRAFRDKRPPQFTGR